MNASVLRPIIAACVVGFVAAMPISISLVARLDWVESPVAYPFVVLAIAVCPPWWIFWAVLGHPDDVQYALKLCGVVLSLNAVLYAPIGIFHVFALRFRPGVRHAIAGVGLLGNR